MMNEVQQNILKFLRQTQKIPEKDRRNGYYIGSNRKMKIDTLYESVVKRKRSSNFHTQEIDTLLSLVKTDKRTIECKKTDQITNTYKDMAWKKIAHIFNDRNLTKRSDKQLRSKWETLKKNARREHTANKLSELSEKVLNILDSDEDVYADFPLQLKEEPVFDDASPHGAVQSFSDVPVQEEQLQQPIGKEVFQNNLTQLLNIEDMSLEEPSSQQSERTTPVLPQNVQWKPIIAQAFVASPGLLIPQSLSRLDGEHRTNKTKDKMLDNATQPGIEVNNMNRKIILSKTLSYSRGTQCDIRKASQKKIFKQNFCCSILTSVHLKSLHKKMMIEENKRKKEKHQIEMDILKTELLIKKHQLSNFE